ncbi:MAG: hypothetical protein DRJ03_10915 [Chloroflexi bacterium]|nr:MAG: hypothetical protein DRJ03_10915 [Chloroflexota bacterium]
MTEDLMSALTTFDGETLKKIHKISLDLLTKRAPRAYLLALSEIMLTYPKATVLHVKNSNALPDDTGVEIIGAGWKGLGGLIAKAFPPLQSAAGIPIEISAEEDGAEGLSVIIMIKGYFPHKELDFMSKLESREVAISTVVEKLKESWVPDDA